MIQVLQNQVSIGAGTRTLLLSKISCQKKLATQRKRVKCGKSVKNSSGWLRFCRLTLSIANANRKRELMRENLNQDSVFVKFLS